MNSIVQGSAADLLCAAVALVHSVLLPAAELLSKSASKGIGADDVE